MSNDLYTYDLIWSDDFTTEKLDLKKWTYDLGQGINGWGNAENQVYTDSEENCFINKDSLIIRGKGSAQKGYTSARITTREKASWTYGRFEIKVKIPKGRGTWPAIWMLPDDLFEGKNWPLCGEIDIMEHIGRRPGEVHFSLHSDVNNHRKENQITSVSTVENLFEDFHLFRMDWDAKGFSFYMDGELMAEFSKGEKNGEREWPFDKPFHLVINLALGGYWGGDMDDSVLPADFAIQYVKVYERKGQ